MNILNSRPLTDNVVIPCIPNFMLGRGKLREYVCKDWKIIIPLFKILVVKPAPHKQKQNRVLCFETEKFYLTNHKYRTVVLHSLIIDWLLKRDETNICKHMVHRTDKYCVLHVTSHR